MIDSRLVEAYKFSNLPTKKEIKGEEMVKKMEDCTKDFRVEIKQGKAVKVTKVGNNFLIKIMGKEKYSAKLLPLVLKGLLSLSASRLI